jgi:NAD-dependent SIR2 family protein deacetylase
MTDIISKMKELNNETIDERLDTIVDKIKNGEINKVIFLLGAGISVDSGIPDFRSDNGFYKNVDPTKFSITNQKDLEIIKDNPAYLLTSQFFERNQLPILEAKRSFIMEFLENKYKPTLTHWFLRLCYDHKILHHIYTQNIDNLENEVGIPSDKITQLHGRLGYAVCYFCNQNYPINDFYNHLKNNIRNIHDFNDSTQSKELLCDNCGKPGIKPDIVLFGEIIKKSLFDATKDADLIIVSGTSLQVYPANKIPLRVPLNCHRMVINNELPFIPDFMEPDTFDLFIEGNCDESFLELASYLGWTDDLVNLIKNNKENNKENISKKSLSLIVDD